MRETQSQIDEARSWGIGGVPTFIVDQQYMIQGAQPAPVLQRVLDQNATGTVPR